MMPTTALKRARSSGSSIAVRSARYPTNSNTSISVSVSRGSHCHQVPQIGRAHIGPVLSIAAPKARPTSADASENVSSRRSLSNR